MPAVKSIPIRNMDGQVVGQRFEASEEVKRNVGRTRTEMIRSDGRTVRLNSKLVSKGHYADRGFTEPQPDRKKESAK